MLKFPIKCQINPKAPSTMKISKKKKKKIRAQINVILVFFAQYFKSLWSKNILKIKYKIGAEKCPKQHKINAQLTLNLRVFK